MMQSLFANQVLMGLKLYFRKPGAVFWMMAFPVLMLLGLGTVFSGSGEQTIKLVWTQTAVQGSPQAAQDGALQAALKELGVTVDSVNEEQADLRWKGGKLPVLLESVDGQYHLRVNSYLAGQGMPIVAMVQQAFLMVQARASGAVQLQRIPLQMESPGGHHDGPYAAFLLPGLLGLNLLMMGVFAVGMVDTDLRVRGIYKRLATTPLPAAVFLGGQMVVRLVTVILSAVLLMVVGGVAFGIRNQGSYVDLFALIFLGTACFASMGYVLASFCRSVEAANGMANLIFMPLMMLSGVYFSLDAAPVWLQKGADMLPLTPLLKSLRAVFNDGAALTSQSSAIMLMVGWTVVMFVLATRRFRWV